MKTVNNWYTIANKYYGRDFLNYRVLLEGFKDLPKAFKPNGQGFPNGKPILEILRLQFKSFKLTVAAKGEFVKAGVPASVLITKTFLK